MNRHIVIPHQFGSGSGNDSSTQRQSGSSHQASNPSASLYSQFHPATHSNISPHQMYPHSVNQGYRHDPRPSMISSLSDSRVPTPSSMQFSEQQAFQPRRVSLLRDIGRAGERDRDLSSTASSLIEGRGLATYYSGVASSRHISTPPSPAVGVSSSYDRPTSMISGMLHPQQTRIQDSSQLGSTPPHALSSLDVKKDPGYMPIKQEMSSKVINPISHPPPQLNVLSQIPAVQRPPGVSSAAKPDPPLLSPGVEQKSKEDLVQAMDKVDRELSKVASEIARLQKRQTQLEESAKRPSEVDKEETSPQTAEPKHRDLWQIIYAESRKKAESARAVLDGICQIYDMPLYNQPSDTQVFQDNLKKNEEMRPKLLKFFQHRRKLSNIREKYLSARYDQIMDDWQKKTEKIENSVKRKTKDAKTREFFEKLFPEIRKQREQQERVERVGTRGDTCKSDADLNQIIDGLSEQENQLKHMRQLAVVPPMLLDKEERRVVFINHNGFINDPFAEFKESQQLDAWADNEKATFKEKYVQHPKNFHVIASFIEKKSVADCILYYYLTKKANNYKSLVRKHNLKPRKPKSGRAHAHHHDQSNSATNKDDKSDKDDNKKDMEVEEQKFDKPPSPRMTRARRQIINWTDEEISLVKEGFGKHGKDFSSISRMVTNKSEQQVKNFYHNYKKKYGLDQLITESKKKKTTRTRHAAVSPDVMLGDDDASSKSSDSTNESKSKPEKDKADDAEVTDDKKKQTDQTPSPASSVSKAEALEIAASSTYRTRRTTAALAAAATQESQEKESNQNKRTSDKIQSSGEPVEKKAKKTDRKSRNQKVTEITRNELAKSEAVRDVVASLSFKSDEKSSSDADEQNPPTESQSKSEADEIADKNSEKNESSIKEEASKNSDDASRSQIDDAKQSNKDARAKKKSEDHDSSATCSADEDTHGSETSQIKSYQARPPHPSSPYFFEDSPKEPLTIRLERKRSTEEASQAPTSIANRNITQTVAEAKSPNNTALNLISKPPAEPPLFTAASNLDERPQSLPPASMVPAVPTKNVWTSSSNELAGLDLSRPNSTPAYPQHFPVVKQPAQDVQALSLVSQYRSEMKVNQQVISTPKSAVISTSSVAVKNIKDLIYPGSVKPSSIVAAPTNVTTSVVDLTRDGAARSMAVAHSHSDFRDAAVPISKHQYHMIHPMAASLHKEHQSYTIPPTVIPVVSQSFQPHTRPYLDKEKTALKDRASAMSGIPVSSLRFPSPNLKASGIMPHQKLTSSAEQNEPQRHPLIKEENKQATAIPVSPSNLIYPFAPRVSVQGQRPIMPSGYPVVSSTPMSVYRKSDKVMSTASEKALPPKHVAISGGSITQGKPVFRAQIPSSGSWQDIQDSQKVAAATASAKSSLMQRTPSPRVTGLPPGENLNRRSSDVIEPIYVPGQGLLPTINPSHLPNMRQFPTFMMPSVKVEKTSDSPTHSKSFNPEDLRHITSASTRGSVLHQDLHFMKASSLSQLPMNMAGLPLMSQAKEEKLSSRMFAGRSTTPPSQPKGMERKSSYAPSPVSDLPPRRPSPLVQQQPLGESHFKEDVKRPASASRATPERRNYPEKSVATHHRVSSTPHLPAHSKPRSTTSSEGKSPDNRGLLMPLTPEQQQQQQFLNATLFSNPTLFHPAVLANFLSNPALSYQTILDQYRLGAGFSPLMPGVPTSRFVSPFPETRDQSSNVIANDYATAKKMAAAAAALQTTVNPHVQASSIVHPSAGLLPPQRSINSPNSLERLNFIPQHSGSIAGSSSRASPHRSDSRRTPNPKSPSSPHSLMKSQFMPSYISPHDAAIPGADKRQSSSPHVMSPNSGQRTPSMSFANVSMALEGRQPSPLLYSVSAKHPSVNNPSYSMSDALLRDPSMLASQFGSSAPQLYRQTASPSSTPSSRSKPSKAEQRHLDSAEFAHHLAESQRQFAFSPDPMVRHFSSDSTRSNQRWESPSHGSLDNLHKPKLSPSNQPGFGDPFAHAKERSDKQQEHHFISDPQNERAAKDLKTKGRAKLTPKILIDTIIDQHISQYAASQDKAKQKMSDSMSSFSVDRKAMENKMKEKASDIDAQFFGIPPKTPPTDKGLSHHHPSNRTTTLLEHSSDIISSMYRSEPNKVPTLDSKSSESRKHDELMTSFSPGNSRFFNAPPTSSSNEQVPKRSDLNRTNFLIHPFTPPVMNMSQSATTTPLESIIRKALMNDASASIASSPPAVPAAESLRRSRADSGSSGHSTPSSRSSFSYHPEKNPVPSFPANTSQEPKRSDSRFGSNSPAPSAPPQMFSALSFRKSQTNTPSQQIPAPAPAPANVCGRPVLPVGSNPASGIGVAPVFHPQSAPASSDPLSSNQYEPLSDDED